MLPFHLVFKFKANYLKHIAIRSAPVAMTHPHNIIRIAIYLIMFPNFH